ncbi:hypothetical protein [Alteromonas sp. C1M14]|uniref:hypothetical protein n=1 Tax=Alteromonas sp. C1M14 TaxID=2841567 RepID=UPI0020919E46|nr:hypothetical protein [Alteromonas sp. C1M14]
MPRCFFTVLVLCHSTIIHAQITESASPKYANAAAFKRVKDRVFSDPYSRLPQYKVTRKLFDKNGENLLLQHAKRTLSSKANFVALASNQKLLQANGICFAGTWTIYPSSSYTGLYRARVDIPAIVRASVSLSGTKQADKRAFGIAIKLFFDGQSDVTENIFLMHSLGGTKTKHVANLPMTNEPKLGELPPFSQLFTAYRLERDLEEADRAFSGKKANPRFRPVSQLADTEVKWEQGEHKENTPANGPYWLKASLKPGTPLVDKEDFRDELALAHYPAHKITWVLSGAPYTEAGIEKAVWREIGELTLTESVVSLTCDTQLHFHHPSL